MSKANNKIVWVWYNLYKTLSGEDINKRVSEIKEATEVHQKIYQLRALELLITKERDHEKITERIRS